MLKVSEKEEHNGGEYNLREPSTCTFSLPSLCSLDPLRRILYHTLFSRVFT